MDGHHMYSYICNRTKPCTLSLDTSCSRLSSMMALGPSKKKQGIQNNRCSYSCWPRLLHSLGKSMKESQHHRHPFHLHKQIHPFGVQPRPRPSSPYKLAVLGVGKAVALPIGLLQPCIGENTHIVIQGHTTQSITHMESKLIYHYIFI